MKAELDLKILLLATKAHAGWHIGAALYMPVWDIGYYFRYKVLSTDPHYCFGLLSHRYVPIHTTYDTVVPDQ